MKRTIFGAALAVVLAASHAPTAFGADLAKLQKAYFGGSKPGAWARYEQVTTDAKGKVTTSVQTVSRLENEGDRVWIETRTEPKEGKPKPSTTKMLMNPDFKVEKNALDFMKFIDRVIVQEDGGKAQEMPMDMFRSVMGGIQLDYGADLEAKGTETVEGKSCDRYELKGAFDAKIAFFRMKGSWTSDLWLNDSVPFGRVKESVTMVDEKGKPMSKIETRLLETGTGATSRIKGPVEKVEMPKMPWGG